MATGSLSMAYISLLGERKCASAWVNKPEPQPRSDQISGVCTGFRKPVISCMATSSSILMTRGLAFRDPVNRVNRRIEGLADQSPVVINLPEVITQMAEQMDQHMIRFYDLAAFLDGKILFKVFIGHSLKGIGDHADRLVQF